MVCVLDVFELCNMVVRMVLLYLVVGLLVCRDEVNFEVMCCMRWLLMVCLN